MAGSRIYRKERKWWEGALREEVAPTSSIQQKFLEKVNVKVKEAFPAEEDENVAPQLEDDKLNPEEAVPPEVENPDEIIDNVEEEDGADKIADQITLEIDGVAYNLVPAKEGEGVEGEEAELGEDEMGVGADLGIDAKAEDTDITQPAEIETPEEEAAESPEEQEEEDEEEETHVKESFRDKLAAKLAERRMRDNLEDNEFLTGSEGEPIENQAGEGSGISGTPLDKQNIGTVMESIEKKQARLKREYIRLAAQKKVLQEYSPGEMTPPKGKDIELAATKGPKNAYTPSNAGEDFKSIVGKGEKFAKRGPGTAVKTAYTKSDAGDNAQVSNSTGSAKFAARGPGSAPEKAYTPSKSGVHPRELENVKQRILARRLNKVDEEKEDELGKRLSAEDVTDDVKKINEYPLDVAKETSEKPVVEKLEKVRAQRLARRSESVEGKEIKEDVESKASENALGSLKESFNFKDLMSGKYNQ